ncbi:MAG: TonB-dependent receptor [Spirosomaceae bacterium]|nr:TonB-dependent receptor [Spirosomataceae bacterium]
MKKLIVLSFRRRRNLLSVVRYPLLELYEESWNADNADANNADLREFLKYLCKSAFENPRYPRSKLSNSNPLYSANPLSVIFSRHKPSHPTSRFSRLASILLFIIYSPSGGQGAFGGQEAFAQTLTQTIRGTVLDKNIQTPIIGAAVTLLGQSQGTTTDAEGNFRLEKVPIGRQSLKISYVGYKESSLTIQVNAGKEVVLNVGIEEDVKQLSEVTVKAPVVKDRPLNDMATVSARTFSVEETQRYAASINDPARMATAFAGIIAPNDESNNIVIRGNAPNGLLWRMEGIEIPNPNHFSSVGQAGGGVSILSAQVLTNSDFMTGAFPAEYGNALSGVFDLRLRKGNNQQREYTVQLGVLGLDVAAEGPFSKKYKGSYLINYRYSTLELLTKLGLPIGDYAQRFQDISYNIALPTKKIGDFTLFGFGGLSGTRNLAVPDSLEWKKNADRRFPERFYSNTGAWGATHTLRFKDKTLLKTVALYSAYRNFDEQNEYTKAYLIEPRFNEDYNLRKLAISSTLNHKFSPRLTLRTGVIWSGQQYELVRESWNATQRRMVSFINSDGQTNVTQAFMQWNYKITPQLALNLGAHYLSLALNQSRSLEPRASIKWDFAQNQTLGLGFGRHSQTNPIALHFFAQNRTDIGLVFPNQNLNFPKADHLVLSYDRLLNEHTRLKLETYRQWLFDIPVNASVKNAFSMVNENDGFVIGTLANAGKGRNYGVELTLERFLHNNFYYLISGSLFDSQYTGSDGIWRNTRYNSGAAANVLAGKEWNVGRGKNNVLGLNLKFTYVGGFRATPIDLEQSRRRGSTVLIESRAFEDRLPDYLRADLRLSWQRNKNGFTGTLALDLRNTTNHTNVFSRFYSASQGRVVFSEQLPIVPILSYRIEF